LVEFLRINSGSISPTDHDLTAAALSKSWNIQEFPGQLDLSDVPGSINRLEEMFEKLKEETMGEALKRL
jgi:hypothetical protein